MKKTLRELLLFGVAGVIGLGVDLALLYLLAPLFGWYVARVISFIAAATATWAFNRHYTFAVEQTGPLWRQWLAYIVTMLGGAAVNYAVYVLALHWLPGPLAPAAGVALGSCAGMAVNYLAARHLVFRRRRGS